ncbi:MAG: CusA/CzcA family heavy metal efflux RND transporter [candidate division WOR-3 bacterium]
MDKLIRWVLKNPFLTLTLTAFLILLGVITVYRTPLDAVPDISDTQVIIEARWEGQDPTTIEDQITYPIVSAMLSAPRTKAVRGFSMPNKSLIYVIFEDGTDIYWARSRVLEYLSGINLPEGVSLRLGPDATALGWVFMYALVDTSGKYDLSFLRTFNDFYLRYKILSADGISDVASVGGYLKEYQIDIDPYKLRAYGLTLNDVIKAVKGSNMQSGGRVIEVSERYYMVRGLGYIKSPEDLEKAVIKTDPESGASIKLGDVAIVQVGSALQEGAADLDGKGEVVGGIVIMRNGENALRVIDNVKRVLSETSLPEGVKFVITYDRSELIKEAVSTLFKTLIKESITVLIVVAIFLFTIRGSLPIVVFLPIALIIPYIFMYAMRITTNIMSLGGMALSIGVMVDAGIVMVENAFKHMEKNPPKTFGEKFEIVYKAISEVAPSLFFSLAIITISFLPVFALTGEEGRLFKPLAFTKTLTMAVATVLSITLMPVLILLILPNRVRSEEQNPINVILHKLYEPVFRISVKYPYVVIGVWLVMSVMAFFILRRIPSEFMPPLNEGSLLYMPSSVAGVPLDKGIEILRKQDSILKTFPEVERVFGKIGRADNPTDPASLSMIETTILLKPEKEWRKGMTIEKLIAEMNEKVQFPGWMNTWGMPIRIRVDMLSTGIRTPLGVKVLGNDPYKVESLAVEVERILSGLKETQTAFADRSAKMLYVDIIPKREKLAEYGLNVSDLMGIIGRVIGGMPLDYAVEGRERYPIRVRLARDFRDEVEDIRDLEFITPTGAVVSFGNVADIKISQAPSMIKSDNGFIASYVYVVPKGDIGMDEYVERAQRVLKENLKLPPGYSFVFSGQYENLKRAQQTMGIIIPLAIIIIFILLYMNFRSFFKSMLVILSVPFTLFGAFGLMYILGYKMSIASWVGVIALLGLAAELGVVMIMFLDLGLKEHPTDPLSGIYEGALRRLRPKVMTATTTFMSLIPIMFETEIGSSVMKRLAAPMIGGVFFAMILVLVVYPAIYKVIYGRGK